MSGSESLLDHMLASRQGRSAGVVDVDASLVKLVIFTLGGDWFAFPGANVREVLADLPVFGLPQCPPWLEGVMNLRGDIESVIRLRLLLGYDEPKAGAPSRILLAEGSALRSGVRVDTVEDVLDAPESSIRPPPHALAPLLQRIVQGVIDFRGNPAVVLDVDRIFEDCWSERA